MPWKASGSTSLPLEEGDWDAAAARRAIFAWAGWPDDPQPDKVRRAFFAYNSDDPEIKGSYKLPFATVRDGRLVAIWSGVTAVAAVLQGARGGANLPDNVKQAIKGKVAVYYHKHDEEPPWEEEKGWGENHIQDTIDALPAIFTPDERCLIEGWRSSGALDFARALILDHLDVAAKKEVESRRRTANEPLPSEMALRVLNEEPDTIMIGGWGVIFGGKDLYGTTFTQEDTDFWLGKFGVPLVFYDHSFDSALGLTVLSTANVEVRDKGLWVTAQINRHQQYMEEVEELIKLGILGWSSGAVGHLVRMRGWTFTSWPIVEFSLTPTPAEPRTLGVHELRSLAPHNAAIRSVLEPNPGWHLTPDGRWYEGPVHDVTLGQAGVTVSVNGDLSDEVIQRVSEQVAASIRAREVHGRTNPPLFIDTGTMTCFPEQLVSGTITCPNGTIIVSQEENPMDENDIQNQDPTQVQEPEQPVAPAAPQSPAFDAEAVATAFADKFMERLAEQQAVAGVQFTPQANTPVRNVGFMLPPTVRMQPRSRRVQRAASPSYRNAFRTWLHQGAHAGPAIRAAMQEGTDSEGGFVVPPQELVELVKAEYELSIVRQAVAASRGRTLTMTSDTMNIPTLTYGAAAVLTTEESAYDEKEPTFGQIVYTAYKYTRLAKASDEMVADAEFDIWGDILVPDWAQAFAAAENAGFTTGSGSSQPQGVVTGAGVGVTAASATAITADELIALYHSLSYLYRARGVWMMNDATIEYVRKIKELSSGGNQYLWQPGLQAGQPDMLLGRPVITNNNMATIAASAKTVLFGDFSYYWIADREDVTVKRLEELYSGNGQIGFRAYKRFDAHVVLTAAFKVLQQKSA